MNTLDRFFTLFNWFNWRILNWFKERHNWALIYCKFMIKIFHLTRLHNSRLKNSLLYKFKSTCACILNIRHPWLLMQTTSISSISINLWLLLLRGIFHLIFFKYTDVISSSNIFIAILIALIFLFITILTLGFQLV